MSEKSVSQQLMAEVPYLRAFAISLSGSVSDADDLVQETLMKAWSKFDSFETGSNLRAWLITILRNSFYSAYRKYRREVPDTEGVHAGRMVVIGGQESHLEMADFRKALDQLSPKYREVLMMIGVADLSYQEAAEICNLPIGTIKSRVNRARIKLVELLGLSGVEDVGSDAVNAAILNSATSIKSAS